MNTDSNVLTTKDLFLPVIFRPDFNSFASINSNQAWSLFFTAGRAEQKLGFNPELGRFFTNLLIASVVTVILWGTFFTHSV
jgi:hypothetical protein